MLILYQISTNCSIAKYILTMTSHQLRQINAQTPAFLIQMAALQAQVLGGVGDMIVIDFQLLNNQLFFDLVQGGFERVPFPDETAVELGLDRQNGLGIFGGKRG